MDVKIGAIASHVKLHHISDFSKHQAWESAAAGDMQGP